MQIELKTALIKQLRNVPNVQVTFVALALEHALTCEEFKLDYGTFGVEHLAAAIENLKTV